MVNFGHALRARSMSGIRQQWNSCGAICPREAGVLRRSPIVARPNRSPLRIAELTCPQLACIPKLIVRFQLRLAGAVRSLADHNKTVASSRPYDTSDRHLFRLLAKNRKEPSSRKTNVDGKSRWRLGETLLPWWTTISNCVKRWDYCCQYSDIAPSYLRQLKNF